MPAGVSSSIPLKEEEEEKQTNKQTKKPESLNETFLAERRVRFASSFFQTKRAIGYEVGRSFFYDLCRFMLLKSIGRLMSNEP